LGKLYLLGRRSLHRRHRKDTALQTPRIVTLFSPQAAHFWFSHARPERAKSQYGMSHLSSHVKVFRPQLGCYLGTAHLARFGLVAIIGMVSLPATADRAQRDPQTMGTAVPTKAPMVHPIAVGAVYCSRCKRSAAAGCPQGGLLVR